MAYANKYRGIVFVEGRIPNAKILSTRVDVDLSFKIGAQLKNLYDVKDRMVECAKKHGANAVLDFEYGQKSRLFAIDDIAFWGKGILAILPKEEYDKINEI